MKDSIYGSFADGHGHAVNLVFIESGFLGYFFCRPLNAVDAVEGGLESVGNPSCL